jgi:predicted kinase
MLLSPKVPSGLRPAAPSACRWTRRCTRGTAATALTIPVSEYFEHERSVVEELRHRLVELVESGRDVVVDYGLWRRCDRDAYERLVEAHGGSWRLLYLKVDREVLGQRLADRNRRANANALTVTPSALEDFIARFEEPAGEGEELVQA